MIIGIGIDLCDEKRVSKVYKKYNSKFVNRICSKNEKLKLYKLKSEIHIIKKLSSLFAAKEATAKALGTGFTHSVFWKDIESYSNSLGKPMIMLTGGALKRQINITPDGHLSVCHISLTRESGMSSATVIIEALLN